MNLPIAPVLATMLGVGAAVAVALLPVPLLERLVLESGIASIVSAAEPPLGSNARALLASGVGGVATLFSWFGLFLLVGTRSFGFRRKAQPVAAGEVPTPVLRRADAHPDAPPRPPLLATRDLGTPFLEVTARDREETRAPMPMSALLDMEQRKVASQASVPPPLSELIALAQKQAEEARHEMVAPVLTPQPVVAPEPEPEPVVALEPVAEAPAPVAAPKPTVIDAVLAPPIMPIFGAPPVADAAPVPESVVAANPWQEPVFEPAPRPVVVPVVQPLPANLDQPLAAFDPSAIPDEPAPLPEAVVPLAPAPRPSVFDTSERFETFPLNPPPAVAVTPAPRDPDAPRPDTEATVHALLERLERGVARRSQPEAASEKLRDSERGLEEALVTLRNLARQA